MVGFSGDGEEVACSGSGAASVDNVMLVNDAAPSGKSVALLGDTFFKVTIAEPSSKESCTFNDVLCFVLDIVSCLGDTSVSFSGAGVTV